VFGVLQQVPAEVVVAPLVVLGELCSHEQRLARGWAHDEVPQGSGLVSKMSGDRWQQFAKLRALLAWIWSVALRSGATRRCKPGKLMGW